MADTSDTYPITIVHTASGMCLTTKQYAGRRDVQLAFDDYKASLGPHEPDELIEYLAVEYPASAPFGQWDVRRLQSRCDAIVWAAQEPRPEGSGLKLGETDRDSLRLAVVGYQFPDEEDPNKRDSWYVLDGSATRGGRDWDFRWAAMTCDAAPRLCSWLFALADWLELEPTDEVAPKAPWLIEPNLQFPGVSVVNGRAEIAVELDLEFLPSEDRDGRRGAGNPEVLSPRATAEELRRGAIDFAESIARFPTELGPSSPVSG